MAKKDEPRNELVRRLDLLIAITLDSMAHDGTMPPASKIRKLSEAGATASEIAVIISKPTNYVTATLSQQRSGKAGAKRGAAKKAKH